MRTGLAVLNSASTPTFRRLSRIRDGFTSKSIVANFPESILSDSRYFSACAARNVTKVNFGRFVEGLGADMAALEHSSQGGGAAADTITNSVMNRVTTTRSMSMSRGAPGLLGN